MTNAAIHDIRFSGALLTRGFWLYVWEIATPLRTRIHYVGRTGDSSSFNAQSPFNRMGQHLGLRKESNTLRRTLIALGFIPEECNFRLIAYGPVADEVRTKEEHRPRRNKIAAIEMALACAMADAGYEVINRVHCNMPLDDVAFAKARMAFASFFPKLLEKPEKEVERV